MPKKSLQIEQLNRKMQAFEGRDNNPPPTGWIRALRLTLGISLEQWGRKLNITKQSMLALEKREKQGSVTLKALQEAAAAMDMKLVYGFVPGDGSLEALIERKARERAREIVMRTHQTMQLEEQENRPERIEKAIDEMTAEFKQAVPKLLWD